MPKRASAGIVIAILNATRSVVVQRFVSEMVCGKSDKFPFSVGLRCEVSGSRSVLWRAQS
jgi:hypothetical protein